GDAVVAGSATEQQGCGVLAGEGRRNARPVGALIYPPAADENQGSAGGNSRRKGGDGDGAPKHKVANIHDGPPRAGRQKPAQGSVKTTIQSGKPNSPDTGI